MRLLLPWIRKRRSPGERRGGGPFALLVSLFGLREIESRVDENFPSWQEFSEEKMRAAAEQRAARKFELPPHHVHVGSPLQRNFAYFLAVACGLALGYAVPGWASALIYTAIIAAFLTGLFVIFRDSLFFHIEGQRLSVDGETVNKHAYGPEEDQGAEKPHSLLHAFTRKKKTIFRSKLFQIHYQNVLRTFEQGNRKAWVDQDASLMDIQTLLSQRGMKVVWTLIEVLPQLGLFGTLIGLMQMFVAFSANAEQPEIAVIAGFGTALGTTILANLFALTLRPLHMQNERAMNEILSTMQMLMSMFILPTQQVVLERSAYGANAPSGLAVPPPYPASFNDARLGRTLEQLAKSLERFTEFQQSLDSGAIARETAQIANEVQRTLRGFQQAFQQDQVAKQVGAVGQLTEAVRELGARLRETGPAAPGVALLGPAAPPKIEHDLMQLRLLTHDTLLLLEQIAGQLQRLTGEPPALLSANERVRAQAFPHHPEHPPPDAEAVEEPPEPASAEVERAQAAPRIRLFEERR